MSGEIRNRLWKLLLNAKRMHPRRLTCEECFALVTHFADLLAGGGSARQVERRAKRHLRYCPDCREHYQERIDELVKRYAERL